MSRKTRPLAEIDREGEGCAYLLATDKDAAPAGHCGAICRPGSSYCLRHHALCHLTRGSRAEKVRLREVKALANMVGGRRARDGEGPPRRFLDRLEQAIREFS